MATYELYVGGPARKGGGYGRSQFPSAPFVEANAEFQNLEVAAHKGPAFFNLTRMLDFGVTGSMASSNSYGLADFMREQPLVQGDKLGIILVPKNYLLLGIAFKVMKPLAAGSVTLSIRGEAFTFAAIDTTAVLEGFLVVNGAAVIQNGLVDLSTAVYKNEPYMIDLELTDITPGPLSALQIEISPLVGRLHSGQM